MPRRRIVGVVIKDKLKKTITVQVTRLKQHPRYKKYIRVRKKYLVHDEHEQAQVGDTVRIVEFRPISKRKRFVLEKIIARGVGEEVALSEEAGVEELSQAIRARETEEKMKKKLAEEAQAEETAQAEEESSEGKQEIAEAQREGGE